MNFKQINEAFEKKYFKNLNEAARKNFMGTYISIEADNYEYSIYDGQKRLLKTSIEKDAEDFINKLIMENGGYLPDSIEMTYIEYANGKAINQYEYKLKERKTPVKKENIEEGIFNKKESELEIQNNVQAYIKAILINILEKAEDFNENIVNRIKSNSKNYVKYSDLVYVISQIAKAAASGKDYNTIQRLINLCEHGTGKINIKFDGKDKLVKELTDLYHKVKGAQDKEDMKNKMADDEFRTNKRKELYSHGIKDSDYYND